MHSVPRRKAMRRERDVCWHIGCRNTHGPGALRRRNWEGRRKTANNAGFDTTVTENPEAEVTTVMRRQ